ncbi:hypothetical protein OEIGOIKO_03014 [Streptomyces chrestomyceticus JCM 4735]|uniref:Uncharacterized protein n=1 Tax=Streptomyces chrestomyceticus JCM 4735 TaxID=1306181 RepID=A0A7U9KWH2_9ACTN|nr:hypothetical protein OEIGOIKO_03014 [Streptomyces chrestomyceticus JCM 4735]
MSTEAERAGRAVAAAGARADALRGCHGPEPDTGAGKDSFAHS